MIAETRNDRLDDRLGFLASGIGFQSQEYNIGAGGVLPLDHDVGRLRYEKS
jgi:hypothetical protein